LCIYAVLWDNQLREMQGKWRFHAGISWGADSLVECDESGRQPRNVKSMMFSIVLYCIVLYCRFNAVLNPVRVMGALQPLAE
jgi:hypothetical protein